MVAIGNQYDAGEPPDQDFLARKAAVAVHHDGHPPAPLVRDDHAVGLPVHGDGHDGWGHLNGLKRAASTDRKIGYVAKVKNIPA